MNLISHLSIHLLLFYSLISCHLSFSINNLPSFAKQWKSISKFHDYATKFKNNEIHNHLDAFRLEMTTNIYDVFIRDWKSSIHSVRKWIYDKDNRTLTDSELEKEDLMWNEWTMASFAIALEIPLDPHMSMHPRLVFEVEGCSHFGQVQSVSSPFASLITEFDADKGLVSCDMKCPEASDILLHQWIPKRDYFGLVLFNPQPLSPCTAFTLLTSGALESFTLTQISVELDSKSVWSNDVLGLVIGNKHRLCSKNVDAALSDLPIRDPISMRLIKGGEECLGLLQSLPPKDYISFYDAFLKTSLSSSSPLIDWPTPLDIIDATFPDLLGKNLFKTSCKDWKSIHVTPQQIYIPMLDAKGPLIKNIYDLSHYAMKLGSISPSNYNQTFDEIISKLSLLCQKCSRFESVSYKSIYDSFKSISLDKCPDSILGGNGQAVLKRLEMLKQISISYSYGIKRKATWKTLKYFQFEKILIADSCPSSSTIEFNLPIQEITDSEYMDEYGTDFIATFTIQSDFQLNRSFNGTGIWNPDTSAFKIQFQMDNSEMTGFYKIKAYLRHKQNTNKSVQIEFPFICGYNSRTVDMNRPADTPLEWMFTSFVNLKPTSSITVPLRYHVSFFDLKNHQGLYDPAIMSFASSMSGLVLLDNARKTTLNSFPFPSAVKNYISMTPSCQSSHMGILIKSRLIFRKDLVKVTPCLEIELIHESIYAPQVSVFLVEFINLNRKFLLLYISDHKDLDLVMKCMEYYRLAYGHQILLITKQGFTLTRSQVDMNNYIHTDNGISSDGFYIPFGSSKNFAQNMIKTQVVDIQAENLCLAPNEDASRLGKHSCQPISEYATWFRSHLIELNHQHLPVRRQLCSSDVFGRNIPLLFTLFQGQVSIVSINLKDITSISDLIHHHRNSASSFLNSFDILLFQGLQSKEDLSQVYKNLISSVGRYEMQSYHSVGMIYKKSRMKSLGCTFEKTGKQEIMACLFTRNDTLFSILNLDHYSSFDFKKQEEDEEEELNGIMFRAYSILCQKYSHRNSKKECNTFSFPMAFTGNWNYKVPIKSNYQDQIKELIVLEKQMFLHRMDKTPLKSFDFVGNIHIPPEYIKMNSSDAFLYKQDLNSQNSLFSWFSSTKEIYRKNWPYTSRIGSLEIDNWVYTWKKEKNDVFLDEESVLFDIFLGSERCDNRQDTQCIKTDPPCSGFKSTFGWKVNAFI